MTTTGPLYDPHQRNAADFSRPERAVLDLITRELRDRDWYPDRDYLCGCWPKALCAIHANQRAVDHYNPEVAP